MVIPEIETANREIDRQSRPIGAENYDLGHILKRDYQI